MGLAKRHKAALHPYSRTSCFSLQYEKDPTYCNECDLYLMLGRNVTICLRYDC